MTLIPIHEIIDVSNQNEGIEMNTTLSLPSQENRNAIALAYQTMDTTITTEVENAWDWLGEISKSHYRTIYQTIRIERVDYEPYKTTDEMFKDLENHIMRISDLNMKHPIWNEETNFAFRIAHDTLGHWDFGKVDNKFNFMGEVGAFESQAGHLKSEIACKALYTEVLGQAAYRGTFGYFPEQKVGFICDRG